MNLPNTTSRYSFSLTVAFVITGTLFWIMQSVIEEDEPKLPPPSFGATLSFLPKLEDREIESDPPEIQPPPEVIPPPEFRPLALETDGAVEIGVEFVAPVADAGPFVPGMADGNELPIVTVAPEYPRRAALQGIEGWVIVEFAVDELGRVQAPRVVDSQPAGVFDKKAVQAVSRYKYKPRVVNGQAVPVPSRRQKIRFNLT